MVKVRDVMSTNVVKVSVSTTVLEACEIMNSKDVSAVAVFQGDKPIGMLTDRGLLRRFIQLNKRPDEVKVGEITRPILRVDANDSTKLAAKKIVKSHFSRLGVFDNEKFLGWITLTDLAREATKSHLKDALLGHNKPERIDVLCPNCQKAFLQKIVNANGEVERWQCLKCKHAL
ncbi:MAG TPA: CBS domain-containing protein [Candidatus Bathyarchaeia archaeon]|nr:CBS domain-containing protein [Candidatus Bathyarchaeia archaeon]